MIVELYVYCCFYKRVQHEWVKFPTKAADKFRNPFDFIIDEEKQSFSTSATPSFSVNEMKPDVMIFKPYEISSSKPPVPGPTINLMRPQPIQATTLEPEEFRPPTYINLKPQKHFELDEFGDPPLFDDLGIDLDSIKEKIKMIVTLKRPSEETLGSPDLSGPVLIALALGFLLLFSGKVHFGDIYGVSILGTIVLYFLLNFMSQRVLIPVYDVMSILGYGLMPMLALGAINVFIRLKGPLGVVIGLGCTAWSSIAATIFIEQIMKLQNKKYLVAYPVFLFYMTFVLITIF